MERVSENDLLGDAETFMPLIDDELLKQTGAFNSQNSSSSEFVQLNHLDSNIPSSQSTENSDYLKAYDDEIPNINDYFADSGLLSDTKESINFDITMNNIESDTVATTDHLASDNIQSNTIDAYDDYTFMEVNESLYKVKPENDQLLMTNVVPLVEETTECNAEYLEGTLIHIPNVLSLPICSSPDEMVSDKYSKIFSDSYLAKVDTKTFNRKVKDLHVPHDQVAKLKRRRRTVKNRGYALNCRQKRNMTNEEMQKEICDLRDLVKQLMAENKSMADQRKTMAAEIGHLKNLVQKMA